MMLWISAAILVTFISGALTAFLSMAGYIHPAFCWVSGTLTGLLIAYCLYKIGDSA